MTPTEFDIAISITDLFFFPDENCDDVQIRSEFLNLLNFLDLKIDIVSFYNFYFDNVKADEGDIYIYDNKKNILVIDLYKDPFDQIDCISLLVRYGGKLNKEFNKMISDFFNNSEYKIAYTANFGSPRLNRILNEPVNEIEPSKLDEFYKKRIRNFISC